MPQPPILSQRTTFEPLSFRAGFPARNLLLPAQEQIPRAVPRFGMTNLEGLVGCRASLGRAGVGTRPYVGGGGFRRVVFPAVWWFPANEI